jgi:hypothetical protein
VERASCVHNQQRAQTTPHTSRSRHTTPRHLYHTFHRTTRASHVSINHVKIVLVEAEQANCSCAYTTARCTRQHMTTQSINATVISPSVTTTPHTHTHTARTAQEKVLAQRHAHVPSIDDTQVDGSTTHQCNAALHQHRMSARSSVGPHHTHSKETAQKTLHGIM